MHEIRDGKTIISSGIIADVPFIKLLILDVIVDTSKFDGIRRTIFCNNCSISVVTESSLKQKRKVNREFWMVLEKHILVRIKFG